MEETPPEQQSVLVTVVASRPFRTRSGTTLVMYADFGGGLRYPLGAGANPLRIPPGVHELQLYSQLARWRVARAAVTVDTRTGPLTVHYASPYNIFERGRAGFVPQRRSIKTYLIAAAAGGAFVAVGSILGRILGT
jgi:hypothetical protein